MVGDLRGLVQAVDRSGDELGNITGPGCPYTLPIAGRTLIEHALAALRDAGATEILVATEAAIAGDIERAMGDPGIPVHLAIHSPGDDDALLRAAFKVFGEGPLLVHLGDSLMGAGLRGGGDAVFTEGGHVLGYSLAKLPAKRLAPPDVEAAELEGSWRYDGSIDGVLIANAVALDHLKRARIGADLSDASVEGRVQIDPSAELSGAKLRGPVYVAPGARIVESYVGPYTSIGAGVTLEGVEIENSIVLPGAQIRYPGRRLEASIVGAGAQVARDYTLPSALRLRVGPSSDIQLS